MIYNEVNRPISEAISTLVPTQSVGTPPQTLCVESRLQQTRHAERGRTDTHGDRGYQNKGQNTLTTLDNPPRLPIHRTAGVLIGAVLLCAALLVGIARAQGPSACLDRFLVRPGDTLTGIANIYGFDWQVIAELNDLQRPYDLYAGQWLCLPAKVGAEAAARTPHPSRVPRFTVRISGRWVEIQTFNFPARNAYVIKAAGSQAPPDEPGYKLGTLRTKKGGDLQARFLLPEELRAIAQIEICLKNATTDELSCQVVSNRK